MQPIAISITHDVHAHREVFSEEGGKYDFDVENGGIVKDDTRTVNVRQIP